MSPADKARTLCPNCGKQVGKALSVTQWISSGDCQCGKLPSTEPGDLKSGSTVAENLCWNCGNPYKPGRDGSFTQWIFRSKLCQCKQPVLHRPGIPRCNVKDRYAKQRRTFSELVKSSQAEASQGESAAALFEERYELIDPLAEEHDGFAVTARDIVLSKFVSIVRFAPLTQEQAVRFQAEVKKLSLIKHPDIVTILHFGLGEDNRPFLISDLFEQPTLYDRLQQQGGYPLDTAIDITLKLCGCLDYAHARGVAHGDLNSDNILLDFEDGEPKVHLIEFGYSDIQSLVRDEQELEQGAATKRDLLSVTSLLYEMLTTSRPFQQLPASQWKTIQLDIPGLEHQDEINVLLSKVFSDTEVAQIRSIKEFQTELTRLGENDAGQAVQSSTAPTRAPQRAGNWTFAIVAAVAAVSITAPIMVLCSSNENHETKNRVTAKRLRHKPQERSPNPETFNIFPPEVEQGNAIDKAIISGQKEVHLMNLELTPERAKKLASAKRIAMISLSNCDGLDNRDVFEVFEQAPCSSFQVNYSGVSDQSFYPLTLNQNIRSLSLNHVELTDETLKNLQNNKNLEGLALAVTKTSNAGIRYLKNLKKLKALSLSSHDYFSDESLKILAGSPPPQLQEIYIANQNISNMGMSYLQSIPSLKRVFLERDETYESGPYITDAGIKTLLRNKRINGIFLSGQKISGSTLQALFEAPHLAELSFIGDEIPPDCQPAPAKCRHLKLLNLRLYKITTTARSLFSKMPIPISSNPTEQLWRDEAAQTTGRANQPP